MRRCWMWGMLAVALQTGVARAQAANQTIDVGGWKVSDSHEGGMFKGCTAINTFSDGSLLGLAATQEVTLIMVSEPKSGLKADGRYQVKYWFDDGSPTTVQGVAKDADLLFVPIPDTDVAPFMAASKLTLSYGGIDYEEPLDGSKNAVAAMAKCMDAGIGPK